MPICPHCGHEIEGSWYRDKGASLGCGTLIIIAVIVSVFSSDGRGEVSRLSQKVDNLTTLVEEIHTSITDTAEP